MDRRLPALESVKLEGVECAMNTRLTSRPSDSSRAWTLIWRFFPPGLRGDCPVGERRNADSHLEKLLKSIGNTGTAHTPFMSGTGSTADPSRGNMNVKADRASGIRQMVRRSLCRRELIWKPGWNSGNAGSRKGHVLLRRDEHSAERRIRDERKSASIDACR